VSRFDKLTKKLTLYLLVIAIIILACFSLSIFSVARQNFDKPKECQDLKFHWNCCKTHLSDIPKIKSSRLQNMIIMDWSSFSLEPSPPYEKFSKFHLAVNKELIKRGDQPIFTHEDYQKLYKILKKGD